MTEDHSYIQSLFADRLGGSLFGKDTKIYKFEKIKRAKRKALIQNPGKELFDLGVGEPDEMAFAGVVKKMQEETAKPENRGYADNGIFEFKEAAVKYLEKNFGVKDLDPSKHINHSIGSKPALAMIPSIYINPGDNVLMTVPGYPVMGIHTKWLGGNVINLPLKEENSFLPDLDSIDTKTKEQAKLLYINYPNNPTGAVATEDFFKKVIDFAGENNIIVVQDAAYAALSYTEKPLSFLSIPGAMEVGIEIHSLSKAFNMTGWRLAFVAGNELVVNGFGNVKDNYDSGQFIAIQKAGIYALEHPSITMEIKKKYKSRLEMLVDALKSAGFNATQPAGTFYLYVKIPKGIKGAKRFVSAEDFSQYLIEEKMISTVPWDDAGAFVRFSATFEAKDIDDGKRIIEEIKTRLSKTKFEF